MKIAEDIARTAGKKLGKVKEYSRTIAHSRSTSPTPIETETCDDDCLPGMGLTRLEAMQITSSPELENYGTLSTD